MSRVVRNPACHHGGKRGGDHLADSVGLVAMSFHQVRQGHLIQRQADGNIREPVVDARVQWVAPAHEAGAAGTARWLDVIVVQQHAVMGQVVERWGERNASIGGFAVAESDIVESLRAARRLRRLACVVGSGLLQRTKSSATTNKMWGDVGCLVAAALRGSNRTRKSKKEARSSIIVRGRAALALAACWIRAADGHDRHDMQKTPNTDILCHAMVGALAVT
jgi:hypothetical protein